MEGMSCKAGDGILPLWTSASIDQSHELSQQLRAKEITATIGIPVEERATTLDTRKASNFPSALACPICHDPFKQNNESNLTSIDCKSCKKTYGITGAYFDLTTSGSSEDFAEPKKISTEIFRSLVVSYLYERGWRQSFLWAGYPGAGREFEMAKECLKPTYGGTIIDASCGSGLFSRMFSSSGLYRCVIALDFSENMLKQCSEYAKREGISRENLAIIRADIGSLPFESSSIEAVHAGAALNCWPYPSAALAEIGRVLRPGGFFVATTYIADRGLFSTFPWSLQIFANLTGQYIARSEREMEQLFEERGFVDFACKRNGLFAMISARKP